MRQSWTKGVDKELAVDINQNFKESLVLRRRLQVLLQEKISLSQKTSRSKEGYENPNWAYLQADARGYERALSEIISLIFDESVVD
ncbi:hypothetical protein D3C81_2094260 [compost metagenome]